METYLWRGIVRTIEYYIGDKNPPNAINNGCYVDPTIRDIIKIQKRF